MANRDKGEVSLSLGGTPYTLVLNMAAMIAAEELAETPTSSPTWDEIVARWGKGSAKAGRIVAWALLRKYHPKLTLEQAGELIDDAGGGEEFAKAYAAAQADPADAKALGMPPTAGKKGKGPQPAERGSESSTSTPGAAD